MNFNKKVYCDKNTKQANYFKPLFSLSIKINPLIGVVDEGYCYGKFLSARKLMFL